MARRNCTGESDEGENSPGNERGVSPGAEIPHVADDGGWKSSGFVTQSSKSNYKAVIVSPEQAFGIMMELEEPYRTPVFLVAVTGLRISEALGLKWGDLDYERRMIHLRRVWVGNDIVEQLKTEGSAAPVPLGDLLADALRGWNQNSPYTKSEDWVFPSLKLTGKTPLSASIMAAHKIRPAALKVGIWFK